MAATTPAGQESASGRRSRLKSGRRAQLIAAAERLFAERGFLAVRLEDIGAAAGVSGPAIYRHFANKEALLVELLVGISTRLLTGARGVSAAQADPAAALKDLIEFHLDFTLGEPDLIRIQDRDLDYLPVAARRQVRAAQRQYVEIWVDHLCRLHPDQPEADARVIAHAVFGLLNSTPHSMKHAGSRSPGLARSRTVLRTATRRAIGLGVTDPAAD